MEATLDKVEYYDTGKLAEVLGVPRKTVQRWAKAGKLPGTVRMGLMWKFDAEEINKAIKTKNLLLW